MTNNYYVIKQEAILLDLLRVISHHRARLATPIRTVQKMCSDTDFDVDPFDDTISTRSRSKKNRPFAALIDPPYKVKPSTHSTITNDDRDGKTDETLPSDFKVDSDEFAVTSSSSQKTSKSQKPKKERSGSTGKETTSKILLTSNEFDSGETTTPSKLDDEKSVVSPPSSLSSSSLSPCLEENIILDTALLSSERTLAVDEELVNSIPAESQEVYQNGSESPICKDKKDGEMSSLPSTKQKD